MSAQATGHVRRLSRVPEIEVDEGLQESWQRFLPRQETQVVAQQAKGIFVPYPLLAILAPILMLLIGGVIGLCTIVYSQNNALSEVKSKNAQLEVYIHDDREKLIRLQTEYENAMRDKKGK